MATRRTRRRSPARRARWLVPDATRPDRRGRTLVTGLESFYNVVHQNSRRYTMHTADLNKLEMREIWYEDDAAMRITATFPFYAGTGNQSSSVVYFEIE